MSAMICIHHMCIVSCLTINASMYREGPTVYKFLQVFYFCDYIPELENNNMFLTFFTIVHMKLT